MSSIKSRQPPARASAGSGPLKHLTASATTCLAILAVVYYSGSVQAAPRNSKRSTSQLVGLDRIKAAPDLVVPIGRGIVTGHVEGGKPNVYMPRRNKQRPDHVTFLPRSGASKTSGHASSTAAVIYGRRGLAPGVRQVHCFAAVDWVTAGCLHTGTPRPPMAGPIRVFNHSWVSLIDAQRAGAILRRVDYLIDTDDVIIIAGVNNGANKKMPPLLAGAYNAIAVGQWNGKSSGGYTRIDQPGRCKPDLVAPGANTSNAAPVVTALAARLLELADQTGGSARRAEVIKAVLMAGADKPPGWTRQPGKPLAEHYGAGRVRFDHSYHMLRRGPIDPGTITSRYGWSFRTTAPGTTESWSFDCVNPCGELSVILTWHRRIKGEVLIDPLSGNAAWLNTPRLADFDLKLIHIDDQGATHVAAASESRIDNVEHLYLPQLPPGRYRLEVIRRDSLTEEWDYALAWRVERGRAESPESRTEAAGPESALLTPDSRLRTQDFSWPYQYLRASDPGEQIRLR